MTADIAKAHAELIKRQTDEDLERKAIKARRKGWFTQEDVDNANRKAKRLLEQIKWT